MHFIDAQSDNKTKVDYAAYKQEWGGAADSAALVAAIALDRMTASRNIIAWMSLTNILSRSRS